MKINMDALKKKLIVIALTVLVFLSAVVLGVATVFRVHSVTVVSSVVSDEAKAEAQELKNRLQEVYDKDSIFFADDEDAKKVLEEFPYFRITSFEKDYPNRIIIKVTEDAEVYAAETGEGDYYILGVDGTVLERRESHLNRMEGKTNVILKGLENVKGEKGKLLSNSETFKALLIFCDQMHTDLNGLQDNVKSVQLHATDKYRVEMSEGVVIYVDQASVLTLEKAKKAMETYKGLNDTQKVKGQVFVSGSDVAGITATYSSEDTLKDMFLG